MASQIGHLARSLEGQKARNSLMRMKCVFLELLYYGGEKKSTCTSIKLESGKAGADI